MGVLTQAARAAICNATLTSHVRLTVKGNLRKDSGLYYLPCLACHVQVRSDRYERHLLKVHKNKGPITRDRGKSKVIAPGLVECGSCGCWIPEKDLYSHTSTAHSAKARHQRQLVQGGLLNPR